MTSHGNGAPVIYSVRFAGMAREQAIQLFQKALLTGNEKRFIAAFRKVHDQLQRRPHEFGEPVYRLAALRLMVYTGAVDPIVVDYGVHEEQPLVFVRLVRAMS